jgi:hypothetical protein
LGVVFSFPISFVHMSPVFLGLVWSDLVSLDFVRIFFCCPVCLFRLVSFISGVKVA